MQDDFIWVCNSLNYVVVSTAAAAGTVSSCVHFCR